MNSKEVKVKVAIFMMQKNESALLESWIRYHGYLVGLENLYIYDNGSEDNSIANTLEHYQKLGVNVETKFNQKAHFERKGELFCEKIKALQSSKSKYDFFIPLDCDEFLAFLDEEGNVSTDRSGLERVLEKYVGRQELLLIESQYYNSVVSDSWFSKQPYRKCFFYKNTIESLDVGFHWGKVRESNEERITRLVHFHFHNKPFSIGKQHATEKLKGRIKDFNIDTIKSYKGAGLHLLRFFTQDELSYIKNQVKQKHYKSLALKNKFCELGIAWPYADSLPDARRKVSFSESNFPSKAPFFDGSIDFVSYNKNTREVFIKGWGIFQGNSEITTIFIALPGHNKIPFEITSRYEREDVAKRLNLNSLAIGFEATVDLKFHLSQVEGIEIETLSFSTAKYFRFNVNKKYREVLESLA